jgi:Rieske 2Fe-2S family protein
MINNRECCHCRVNHKGLLKLFDASSFNGATTPAYDELFTSATRRWAELGLAWEEQAFEPNDCCRVARYPMQEDYKSTTFDGQPASKKLIGPFAEHDSSTLSMWFNPNAWVHFTSDHIATNWVLPLDAERCTLYSSWIVHEDAIEGEDYDVEHLTDIWRVTNAEDVDLCRSMTSGAKSDYYRPGPFSDDEQFCTQFCDWYMNYSA